MIEIERKKKPRQRTKISTDDRPGEIGKSYVNVDSGVEGTIFKYEDKYKTLMMEIADGKYDVMTYGTFKKKWKEK